MEELICCNIKRADECLFLYLGIVTAYQSGFDVAFPKVLQTLSYSWVTVQPNLNKTRKVHLILTLYFDAPITLSETHPTPLNRHVPGSAR